MVRSILRRLISLFVFMALNFRLSAHLRLPTTSHKPTASAMAGWRLACLVMLSWPLGAGVHAQESVAPTTSSTNTVALPALGDAAAQDLSPMAERRLGDRIMRSILRDPDVIDDPLVLDYVNQVWQALLNSARRHGEIGPEIDASHAWVPFLVRDRSVNAFALPGGYIGVHFGLLAMTTTPDELASVLAHEMSHVTQRHIARMISQQSRQTWMSVASMVLGILAASRNPAAAQAMIYGGQAVAIQGQLNFSRDMEREADRIGFGVLGDAGFEPAGMAQMFEHLQQASRLNDDGNFPYLRTHPLTTERIGEAHARVGPQGWANATKAGHTDSALWAQHALMAARSRVLMDTRNVSLQNLLTADIKPGSTALQNVTAYYTSAVALQRGADSGRATLALNHAKGAAKGLPPDQQTVVSRVLTLAMVEVMLMNHKPVEAYALLEREGLINHSTKQPEEARPELLLTAQVALSLPEGRTQSAAQNQVASNLQTHVSNHPHDAAAWAILGELWQRLAQPLRAVRAEAEATAALGDLPGAIDRIQGAQKRFRQPNADDVIELSVMDARLKVWQRQQREDLLDDRGG
ncbi:MAG: M48 family metalloprotease [Aquabacterium sp.]|nr:M48 family metalloprotease [Aquabacterium sp.]